MSKSTVVQDAYKDYCFFCGTANISGEHHLIFGNGRRKLAEEDGLKAPICGKCHTMGEKVGRVHDNSMAEKLSKMLGQAIYERNECTKGVSLDDARENFRKRYNVSFW
ncbi:hypothetical protein [Kineothrix sp. MB12-C1]|uniref:hypothetical protein n=1 Tax=Kineothrix sp. MB12-C1 TaxID=3070215 RepID=UPI0027D277CD|nr:hypothetical protein [Kineothrix sp. MB12-C1]WMC91228.1 hypothetical protein RBB56_10060 [Kineothrix sp. MB12-C1]